LPAGVQLRSYHPVWRPRGLNRRDHKKVIVIDKQKAFVGSLNLTDKSFLWRETGLFVTGEEVKKIALAFEKIWSRSRHSSKISQLTRLPLSLPSRLFHSDLLIFNHSYRLRFRSHRYWLKLLRQTQTRLWMTTPYFVPTFRQQAALSSLAERGVDVRIIIPKQSDLPWMMPLSYFFLNKLIKKGARVYEFLPQILHAKTLLIDERAFVGTSNWNHRSWLWDLEIDVAITHDENLKNMQQQFLNDLGCSRLISSPSSLPRFLLHFIVARLLWLFRRFL
jgi:cardiolipin synthase